MPTRIYINSTFLCLILTTIDTVGTPSGTHLPVKNDTGKFEYAMRKLRFPNGFSSIFGKSA